MMCRKHDTALKTQTGKLDPVRFVSPESASPRLRYKTAGARAPSSRLCRPYRELVIAPSSVRSTYIHRPGEEGEERIVAHARAHSKQYR
jgi:hypothetical protein